MIADSQFDLIRLQGCLTAFPRTTRFPTLEAAGRTRTGQTRLGDL
jgi:hypothetical protein